VYYILYCKLFKPILYILAILFMSLIVIIVNKGGEASELKIKVFSEVNLYKKCGFKSANGFLKHATWSVSMDGKKYIVQLFAKDDGRAGSENKYDLPPPVDNVLYFGSCVLVCMIKYDSGDVGYVDLTLEMWEKMYEKLFGGFENLVMTCEDDDEEEDELENVPPELKTKTGYLKDGFVVSDTNSDNISDETEEQNYADDDNESELSVEPYV